MTNELNFKSKTPLAPQGLGDLPRDFFGNGRIFATVSAHAGITAISYWGRQHAGATCFFQGDPESIWEKLFRVYARIGEKLYYLRLNQTLLYPFGYSSHCEVAGIKFDHELLLLNDALVQRFKVVKGFRKIPVHIETLHQEASTAVTRSDRTWTDFRFDQKLNALIASCTDIDPKRLEGDDGLAQRGLKFSSGGRAKATTWIGLGCDSSMEYRRGHHPRSKHYLCGSRIKGQTAALFLVFANSREALAKRLRELSKSVHQECKALIVNYEKRLAASPQINTGNQVLNSAFAQYPECIHAMKVPDRRGAIRGTLAGYFVWGWDGMMAPFALDLANEQPAAAATLRFYQETLSRKIGIPHSFSGTFETRFRAPFPSQAQFIAALYHYVSATGDISLAKELLPTCKFILDRCRERVVQSTGLVEGLALWPDFPEAMGENGHDISSLNNSLFYQGLRAMEFLAYAHGDGKLARECCEWAQALRKSFIRYLYDEEKGFFLSSCDSRTFKPRKHYCPQSIFWLTPFARELVSHAPIRIARFMNKHLRAERCLLTLPRWDSAWMADGNQLGSSFPSADLFYLNLNKIIGNQAALATWTADVEWFWRRHTVPEAFTPEADNEVEMGVDNPGCKQLQACASWYVGVYIGLAGLDWDHEGVTFTPAGKMPISIRRLRLRGVSVDLEIKGAGTHIGSLKLDGQPLPRGSRKIAWTQLKNNHSKIELARSERPDYPTIIRADGLRIDILKSEKKRLIANISGTIFGEILLQTLPSAKISVDGKAAKIARHPETGILMLSFRPEQKRIQLEVSS
jgi:hypothetical protein